MPEDFTMMVVVGMMTLCLLPFTLKFLRFGFKLWCEAWRDLGD